MCFSAKGRFEADKGVCIVRNHEKFRERFGVSPCLICQGYDSEVNKCDRELADDEIEIIYSQSKEEKFIRKR